jgi:protein-L-isoaspartate(D-aspartate) O-methyltransferase
MVERLRSQGIRSERVLAAMGEVPRHLFVPRSQQERAYEEVEIPLGSGEVLCRPYLLALSVQFLDLKPKEKVLQVGVGCGYCLAVLSEIAPNAYAIDRHDEAVRAAQERLRSIRRSTVRWSSGDACKGWPEHAPYDAIMVACASEQVPDSLVQELREGGRMVVPIGSGPEQTLTCYRKTAGRLRAEAIMAVRVKPMECQTCRR